MEYFKPLQHTAYDTLKDMILNDRFQSDIIYSETKLSKELGISRTPLRDAIQRLAQEKYIDVIPSKGFRLHYMTPQDVLDTFQVRCAIEGFCVLQMTLDHNQPRCLESVNTMKKLIDNQVQITKTSRSIKDFTKYDLEYHLQIVQYVNNQSILDLFHRYFYQVNRQASLSLQQEGRMEQTVHEHRKIVSSIEKGSITKSFSAVLLHLEKPRQIIETLGLIDNIQ